MVGTAGGEPLDDDVVFCDELVQVAVPVREGAPEHHCRLPHSFGSWWRAGERCVVVDEAGVEVAVDRAQVACGEQLLDECLDNFLVGGGAIGCHAVKPYSRRAGAPSQECGIPKGSAAEHT